MVGRVPHHADPIQTPCDVRHAILARDRFFWGFLICLAGPCSGGSPGGREGGLKDRGLYFSIGGGEGWSCPGGGDGGDWGGCYGLWTNGVGRERLRGVD
jgi:hypothetical protein